MLFKSSQKLARLLFDKNNLKCRDSRVYIIHFPQTQADFSASLCEFVLESVEVESKLG